MKDKRNGAASDKDDQVEEMPDTATAMLKADHKKVKGIFSQWEDSDDEEECADLMEQAIAELKVHTRVEEEIFYPAAREEMDDEDLLNEAEEEHHVAKMLIGEIEKLDSGDARCQAKFKVLMENVKHHIREEEGEMFPKIEDADFNTEIVEQMWERKQELTQEVMGTGAATPTKESSKGKGASSGSPSRH